MVQHIVALATYVGDRAPQRKPTLARLPQLKRGLGLTRPTSPCDTLSRGATVWPQRGPRRSH
eukprot:7174698-Lingulodinium_polyedra.AAC.1